MSAIADDIAYNNHDLEDGLRANLFSINKLRSIPQISNIIKRHLKNINKYRKEIIINQIVRDLINFMVIDVIKTTKNNLRKIDPKSIKDIYNHDSYIVNFSEKMKKIDREIKMFLSKNMYNHNKVKINTNRGKKIVYDLFKHLLKNPKKYINKELFKKDKKERIVADFIAGMTDRYAINLHKKII